jgi:hypothetical protein
MVAKATLHRGDGDSASPRTGQERTDRPACDRRGCGYRNAAGNAAPSPSLVLADGIQTQHIKYTDCGHSMHTMQRVSLCV